MTTNDRFAFHAILSEAERFDEHGSKVDQPEMDHSERDAFAAYLRWAITRCPTIRYPHGKLAFIRATNNHHQ